MTMAYREVLTRRWLRDSVPVWRPRGLDLGRMAKCPNIKSPTRPLAARLLGVDEARLLSIPNNSDLGGREGDLLG